MGLWGVWVSLLCFSCVGVGWAAHVSIRSCCYQSQRRCPISTSCHPVTVSSKIRRPVPRRFRFLSVTKIHGIISRVSIVSLLFPLPCCPAVPLVNLPTSPSSQPAPTPPPNVLLFPAQNKSKKSNSPLRRPQPAFPVTSSGVASRKPCSVTPHLRREVARASLRRGVDDAGVLREFLIDLRPPPFQ